MNNKPKIVYIWKSPYPWDVRVERICKCFSDVADVVILARWQNEKLEEEKVDDFYIKRVGFQKKSFASSPYPINQLWKKEIESAISRFKPNFVIVREIMLAEMAAKAAHNVGISCIIDMAENYPAAMREWKKYDESLLRKIAVHYLKIPDLVEQRAVNNADFIITVCQEQNVRLEQQYNFQSQKLIEVNNTPSVEFGKILNKPQSDNIVFGHHGYLSADKNLDKFITGFAKAVDLSNSNIQLHLYGDGESREDLELLTTKLNMKNNIKFFGSYNFNDLDTILQTFDFGVIPYAPNNFNNYTIHNKFFDFIAKGKPILASETLPYKRIFSENQIGLCNNCQDTNVIANSIIEIMKLDYDAMAKTAFNLFQSKYNWEIEKKRLNDFIEKKELMN